MDAYTVVINAGSSSLKFCIYRTPEAGEWPLEARGQIEGIGTSPRFTAKNGDGEKLADNALDAKAVHDGSAARKCSASATASCTAAHTLPDRHASRRKWSRSCAR